MQVRRTRARVRALAAVLAAAGLVAAGCSDDSSSTSAGTSTSAASTTTTAVSTTTTTTWSSPVAAATVEGPVTSPGQIVLGVPGFDLATVGYRESEFFVSGAASAYTSDAPLSPDGTWTVREAGKADYKTRVVVRRPADAAKFNGTVLVEWLNVTGGLDAAPDWVYTHVELIRSGYAWVGVSAQKVGVEGGGNALGASRVLKTADPARYGSLKHPGDAYSYDIFSQAGAVVRRNAATVLGGLTPARVVAIGESQSASRLTTYVNAVEPAQRVFDGYLLHSRGAAGAALSGDPLPALAAPSPTRIRGDLKVPVMIFLSETDVAGDRLNWRLAEQPDTEKLRVWEVAGTAHADGYNLGIGDTDDGSGKGDAALFAALAKPSASVYDGLLTCEKPINFGPQTYVLRSAIAKLDAWVRTGKPPASMPRLEVAADAKSYVVDEVGNAKGGIRTPHVDAPLATLTGLGQSGSSFCFLFGTTAPLPNDKLVALHGTTDAFVTKWANATKQAASTGAILEADVARLLDLGKTVTIGR